MRAEPQPGKGNTVNNQAEEGTKLETTLQSARRSKKSSETVCRNEPVQQTAAVILVSGKVQPLGAAEAA
jgi:hypothetical protein